MYTLCSLHLLSQFFYIIFEGFVFKKYPAQKSVRKQILDRAIPEKEEQVMTKEVKEQLCYFV